MTGFKHGITGYSEHGCRCEVCRAAKSAADKRFSANRGEARRAAARRAKRDRRDRACKRCHTTMIEPTPDQLCGFCIEELEIEAAA